MLTVQGGLKRPARFALALAVAAISLAAAVSPSAAQRALRVPSQFPTLFDATRAGVPGDTVLVAPGEYRERIMLTPGLVFRSEKGADSTTLWGMAMNVIEVRGGQDTTRIQGFTLNCRRGSEIGISVVGSVCVIENNVIQNATEGINWQEGAGAIRDNRIHACRTGITLSAASPQVERNTILGNVDGMRLVSSSPIVQNNRFEKNRNAIQLELYSYPVIGGGLSAANDFIENGMNLVNSTLATVGTTRTQDLAVLVAKYNYWGSDCPMEGPRRFFGRCQIKPWTDEAHREKYLDCPPKPAGESAPAGGASGTGAPGGDD